MTGREKRKRGCAPTEASKSQRLWTVPYVVLYYLWFFSTLRSPKEQTPKQHT